MQEKVKKYNAIKINIFKCYRMKENDSKCYRIQEIATKY
jgi:hypothetical protein